MGSPSYLVKKQDTYYFRQAWPQSVKSKIGQREIVRSLGVKEKSLAIRMAREFKVNLDHFVDELVAYAQTDTSGTMQLLDASLTRIKLKYNSSCTRTGSAPEPFQSPVLLPATDTHRETVDSPASAGTNKTKIIPLFAKYSAEKTRLQQWSPKSLKERAGHFKLIVSLLKNIKNEREIYIEDVKVEDVRKIKELLLVLPKNHNKKFPKISLTELIRRCVCIENEQFDGMSAEEVKNIQDKISLNTITDKYASTIKGFWKWLNDQEYIDTDAFHVLRYDFKKSTNSWKTFTVEDLNTLFNDKTYYNANSEFSYQYFVPIISLFSSMRLQEICQLRVIDIIHVDKIYAFNIVDDNGTSLKTKNSERTIPIHNDLISCGLLGYVEYLKINNEKYLFPDLKNDDNSTECRRVSKWFNERYKIKKGIGAGKSFHSFRRTFINEMSRNGVSDSNIRELVGHKPDKADTLNNHYKDSLSIQEKNRLINECIKFEYCNFPWRKN